MMNPFFGDIWASFSPGVIGWAILGLVAAAMGWAAVMTALNSTRQFLNFHKPTPEDDFQSHRKVLDDLKTSLAGLAPNEKVNQLINKLSSFATQEQIRKIELELPELIKREELQRCLDKLDKDIQAQMKEQREYVHNAVHGLRNDINGWRLSEESGREGMHNRMNAFSEVLYEMRGALQAIKERTGAK